MNKTIVVTGGSRGIGKSIIEKFAAEGFDIITCARSSEQLESLKNHIKLQYPEINIHTKSIDLSVKKDVENFVLFVQSFSLPIDVLVNNTGKFVQGQLHNEEEGLLEELMRVNLYSAYHTTRGLIGGMMERKQGHIFNICSTASIIPYTFGSSYCITKHALLGMSKVLREEMKPYNIKVCTVLPGATYTDSWAGIDLPIERFILPEAVAESIFSVYSLKGGANVEELLIRPQLGDI